MSFNGVILEGQVVATGRIALPNGTKVRIELETEEGPRPSLAEDLREFIGAFEGLPPDLAKNHDHYLHGAPRR